MFVSKLKPLCGSLVLRKSFRAKSTTTHEDGFKVIYKFAPIGLCSALNKFKKLQLVAAGSAIPGSYIAEWYNLCDGSLPPVIATVGLASTVAVFSIGQLFTDMIGYVYFNKETQDIKLSYVDFWGNRKNSIHGPEDFLPLTHSPKYITDFLFRRLYLYDSRYPYKISLKYGNIIDPTALKTTFCLDDLDFNET
ncbi:hypothetical protein O3M35_006286 [Rhynocoris fuscipes]|uniref:Transmembrane protein 186 n=1 Tax=Rhynocoris fuscipes TaxID=488301 RepID=A0AAW1DFA9_9HEMI